MKLCAVFILFGFVFYNPASCESIELSENNIGNVLADHECVFINFYVDWCRFSQMMGPVFEQATEMILKEFGTNTDRVAMGKVNCDVEKEIAKRFAITKYPTLKISLNGDVMKREYRGQRSAEALVNYIRNQLKDPIVEIKTLEQLNAINSTKRTIIAYFDRHDTTTPEYNIYRKVAVSLKEDCLFFAGFDPAISNVAAGSPPTIVFRPDVAASHDQEIIYTGKIHGDELKIWAQEKCIPLVREITFDNAEELTEEGLPFMILFYHPNNTQPIKEYKALIEQELIGEKQNVNFLTADGKMFAHPLQHLDKTLDDLPVIAIDSFRHMYLFPDFNDIYKPGRLRRFVSDLHSGKLHREFHYGPEKDKTDSKEEAKPEVKTEAKAEVKPEVKTEDKPEGGSKEEGKEVVKEASKEEGEVASKEASEVASKEEAKPEADSKVEHSGEELSKPKSQPSENEIGDETEESPRDSTFIKLAPSDKRYTLLRNEL